MSDKPQYWSSEVTGEEAKALVRRGAGASGR
jgi:hypothetical protein